MSTATAPAKTKLPSISLGPCLYYATPGDAPVVALVTRPGSVVTLIAFPQETGRGLIRESVRHVSDPDAAKYAEQHFGLWDFTDETKAIMAIAAQLGK